MLLLFFGASTMMKISYLFIIIRLMGKYQETVNKYNILQEIINAMDTYIDILG